jgi:hypothetical protein
MENEMSVIINEINELTGYEIGELIGCGLVPMKHAKMWLVHRHYYAQAKQGRKYSEIKAELSERYGVSVSTIEKMIYRRKKNE